MKAITNHVANLADLTVIILAAGVGSRMRTKLPKVLHTLAGKPLIVHVLAKAIALAPKQIIIVYGHEEQQLMEAVNTHYPNNQFLWVRQSPPLGTADAVLQVSKQIPNTFIDTSTDSANKHSSAATLILYADVPLVHEATLKHMLSAYLAPKDANNNVAMVMLTAIAHNPSGYGRILRDVDGNITRVVEDRDADEDTLAIHEINSGIYLINNYLLHDLLPQITASAISGEFYLTEIIALIKNSAHNKTISSVTVKDFYEIMGVNDQIQLERLKRYHQQQMAHMLLQAGLNISDSSRIDIRGQIKHGSDCLIDINCIFEGEVVLANNVQIGAGVILKNVTIGNNVIIKPYSVIEGAIIGDDVEIGPYARIRPQSQLLAKSKVGNFVEVKNTILGAASKANHLSYLGDAIIGANVNIGAGSVTCNYDGRNKNSTIIEDNVFVGSGTMLVAPITVKQGGLIGAGSTITKDTEANELTVARSKQLTVRGFKRR